MVLMWKPTILEGSLTRARDDNILIGERCAASVVKNSRYLFIRVIKCITCGCKTYLSWLCTLGLWESSCAKLAMPTHERFCQERRRPPCIQITSKVTRTHTKFMKCRSVWVIDQACSVKMAGYWPSSFLSIKPQKKNEDNIQPS